MFLSTQKLISLFLYLNLSAPDKKGYRDNLGIISHISPKNVFCDPSLEQSHQDGSNEGSQYMFFVTPH